jgi:hypothetical protein
VQDILQDLASRLVAEEPVVEAAVAAQADAAGGWKDVGEQGFSDVSDLTDPDEYEGDVEGGNTQGTSVNDVGADFHNEPGWCAAMLLSPGDVLLW